MKVVKAYHGTNSRFSQFDQSKSRIANDFYGGGVAYFTDSLEIAKTYASSMSRRFGGDKFIYQVEVKFDRLFDVDAKYTKDVLKKLIGTSNLENFARGAGLLKLGSDRTRVLAELHEGNIELTGDQVFRGLSGGMIRTSKTRETIRRAGFDGLRYNGGVNMGMAVRHNVYLAYEARKIKIIKRHIVSPTPVPFESQRETYTYIH